MTRSMNKYDYMFKNFVNCTHDLGNIKNVF